MAYEIQIIEGHDPSSYFWFHPAILQKKEMIDLFDVTLLEDEFSIEEEDVYCFLSYFLNKYFDEKLISNWERYDYSSCEYIHCFEWNLTHNFYTYATMEHMMDEITEVSELLKKDYDNEILKPIKKQFSTYYMCSCEDPDHGSSDPETIKRHVEVVIDFYHRFVHRVRKMMENNKETDLMSIMGP